MKRVYFLLAIIAGFILGACHAALAAPSIPEYKWCTPADLKKPGVLPCCKLKFATIRWYYFCGTGGESKTGLGSACEQVRSSAKSYCKDDAKCFSQYEKRLEGCFKGQKEILDILRQKEQSNTQTGVKKSAPEPARATPTTRRIRSTPSRQTDDDDSPCPDGRPLMTNGYCP